MAAPAPIQRVYQKLLDRSLPRDATCAARELRLLVNGGEVFPAMLADIERARREVVLLVYIFRDDRIGWRFAHALAEAARRGVDVRVAYDAVGNLEVGHEHMDFMRDAGVQVREVNPLWPTRLRDLWHVNTRDHRKLLVVDRRVGYVAGLNIGDEYDGHAEDHGHWRDNGVRLVGPVCRYLSTLGKATFARTWAQPPPHRQACSLNGDTPVWVHSPPSLADRNQIYMLHEVLIRSARRYIWIMNSYFVPTSRLLQRLTEAVQRGVDVRLILPGVSDIAVTSMAARGAHQFLLRRGIHVYELTGTILHGKTMVIDDQVLTIGSANLDFRSFRYNREIVLTILDRTLAQEARAQLERDMERSNRMTLKHIRHRSFWHQVGGSMFYALAPLL